MSSLPVNNKNTFDKVHKKVSPRIFRVPLYVSPSPIGYAEDANPVYMAKVQRESCSLVFSGVFLPTCMNIDTCKFSSIGAQKGLKHFKKLSWFIYHFV